MSGLSVTPDELYAEACRALGEQVVHSRLLSQHVGVLSDQIDGRAAQDALAADTPTEEPTT